MGKVVKLLTHLSIFLVVHLMLIGITIILIKKKVDKIKEDLDFVKEIVKKERNK